MLDQFELAYFLHSVDIQYKVISKDGIVPKVLFPHSAGFHLYSSHHITIPKKKHSVISTGIMIQLPKNCYGRIAPRSGFEAQHGVFVAPGVLDPGFQGEIEIVVFNASECDYLFGKGYRVAQIICEKFIPPVLTEMKCNFFTSKWYQL